MSFGQPLWFWGFAFLPLLIVLYARNESRRSKLLKQLVAARLLDRLAGTVSLRMRRLRFALLLLGFAALLVSLAQPRYGYTWEESKRQGRDVLIAIDCSKSMNATDLSPSRLARAKLATQDLIGQLPGDRVGLIAFAGTAFLQAPLTIDYSAVLNSLSEMNTEIIPRGGTNISAAIAEADAAFGKGESENRCLIIFTDGEDLEADAVAAANAEKDQMRIFTVGLGSTEGSLIPVPGENGGTSFVKDEQGQIVKSRLDEDRLRKIAETTGGFYVHLQNGPAEMKQIIRDGLAQMKEKEIDARLARRPIERYQWPLSAALVLLVTSSMIGERKRSARRSAVPVAARVATAVLLLLLPVAVQAKNSGIEAYEREDYKGAMTEFDKQLQKRKESAELNFDLGTAAYKAGELGKALDAFSNAMTSPDPSLRSAAEYNLGNTLFQQGAQQQQKDQRVQRWKDALQHYEQALKVTPGNKDAEYNRDVVRKLLEETQKEPLKQDQQQQQQQKDKKDDQKKDDQQKQQQDQQQQQQNKDDQKKDQKDQQQQQQSKGGQQDQQNQQQQGQSQQSQSQQQQGQNQQSQQGSQGQQQQNQQQGNAQQDKEQNNGQQGQQNPQPQNGQGNEKRDAKSNPAGGDQQQQQPQSQDGQGEPLKPSTEQSGKKHEGEIKAQGNPQQQQGEQGDPQQEAAAEAQAAQEGKMTAAQAKTLLESMKDEDQRVQLLKPKTGKPMGRNFRDW